MSIGLICPAFTPRFEFRQIYRSTDKLTITVRVGIA